MTTESSAMMPPKAVLQLNAIAQASGICAGAEAVGESLSKAITEMSQCIDLSHPVATASDASSGAPHIAKEVAMRAGAVATQRKTIGGNTVEALFPAVEHSAWQVQRAAVLELWLEEFERQRLLRWQRAWEAWRISGTAAPVPDGGKGKGRKGALDDGEYITVSEKEWGSFIALAAPHIALLPAHARMLWHLAVHAETALGTSTYTADLKREAAEAAAAEQGASEQSGPTLMASTGTALQHLKGTKLYIKGKAAMTLGQARAASISTNARISWPSFVTAAERCGIFHDDWRLLPTVDMELIMSQVCVHMQL